MNKTHSFQAEIKELLNLMIHSLYSHREIFLRELISNASDALDKRKFAALTDEAMLPKDSELKIELETDPAQKMLKIRDNGIGMSFDEAMKNLGTIAHSGTKELLKHAGELKDRPELIGQFGVGFYSAFMVADKVTVHTQKAGTTEGVLWESTGDGTYSIDHVPRPEGVGTTLTLKLKEFKEDDNVEDFTSEWTLKSLIKKYSDFIKYPIQYKNEKQEWTTLNSQKALWLKSPSEIKEEEYKEFYQQLTYDWNPPLKTIHYKAEGTLEYNALLYIPSKQPMNYYAREHEWGLSLYIRRVFIMNNCSELLPPYLRFVRGLVDSADLSLNVSREMLQHDRQVTAIKKSLVGKVLNHLKDMLTKERSTYENFWTEFGSTIKEGLPSEPAQKEKLTELVLFHSSHSDKMTTLEEYAGRMVKDQKHIYFITGDSLNVLQNSPYLEKVRAKGYEVLFCIDPVDEWVMDSFGDYKEFKFQSITKGELDIDTPEEKEAQKGLKEKYQPLLDVIMKVLGEHIKEVKTSDRLTNSPACLVADQHDPSAHMMRLMEKMGQSSQTPKRILEVNLSHPLFEKMMEAPANIQEKWAEILFYQALIFEGSALPNPKRFSEHISELMVQAQPALAMKH